MITATSTRDNDDAVMSRAVMSDAVISDAVISSKPVVKTTVYIKNEAKAHDRRRHNDDELHFSNTILQTPSRIVQTQCIASLRRTAGVVQHHKNHKNHSSDNSHKSQFRQWR
jgi:hypothetical protein